MHIGENFLEDTRPAISPNAGHRLSLHWTDADRRHLSERIRRKYPNVIFYETLNPVEEVSETQPDIRFIKNLDEANLWKSVTALFPPPAWRPEMIRIERINSTLKPYWTWSNYLSPKISFSVRSDESEKSDWFGKATDAPIEYWRTSTILTSYRREIETERKIQSSILRMAASPCRQLVPVKWDTYESYIERKGRVTAAFLRSGRHLASPSVVDWMRVKPEREIEFHVWRSWLSAYTTHLPEDVPDSWWGDTPKPKWAQRP